MHHNAGDEPNECIFATMLEFLSDQWGGTLRDPDLLRSPRRLGPDRGLPLPPPGAPDAPAAGTGGERLVCKAPSHLSQLRTLFAVYPDARVVQLHPHPLKTVPSTVSLMGTIRSMRCEVDVEGSLPRSRSGTP